MGCDGRIRRTTGIGKSAAGMAALFYWAMKTFVGVSLLAMAVCYSTQLLAG
jgi:hypothetical protein